MEKVSGFDFQPIQIDRNGTLAGGADELAQHVKSVHVTDVIIMCHEVSRHQILGLPDYDTPTIPEAIELTLTLARRTNPRVRCAGVSLNTSKLTADDASVLLAHYSDMLQMPVADPLRTGAAFERLVTNCLGTAA